MKNKKGFTLVELLVTITIIAILATIGLAVYSSVQKSARMAKRISDLKAIRSALEQYYTANRIYPTTAIGADSGLRSECITGGTFPSNEVIPNPVGYPSFVPNYMPAFPADSQMNTTNSTSCYMYRSNGTDYKFFVYAVTEITLSDLQAQPTLWDPRYPGHPSVCVGGLATDPNLRFASYSLGGRCW